MKPFAGPIPFFIDSERWSDVVRRVGYYQLGDTIGQSPESVNTISLKYDIQWLHLSKDNDVLVVDVRNVGVGVSVWKYSLVALVEHIEGL